MQMGREGLYGVWDFGLLQVFGAGFVQPLRKMRGFFAPLRMTAVKFMGVRNDNVKSQGISE